MKKLLFLITALIILFPFIGFSQPGCPAVTIPDTTVCGAGCVPITANPVSGVTTTTYTVNQIAYTPFPTAGTNQLFINIDDTWSPVINMPFTFCFFGQSYNQMVVGSNGLISFDISQANGFCPYTIANAIPSPAVPGASIMAPWHDIDPSVSGSSPNVNWQVYGTAPCRTMVISWNSIAMYSCTNLIATQQIVLYETTNIVETYIANKPLCTSWNSGAAIHGIQNAAGTNAFVVPGRNFPAQWTAQNDAWAFIPNGAPNYSIYWYQLGNPVPIDSGLTATLCPPGTTTNYVAEVIYNNCGSGTVTVYDTNTVSIINTPLTINLTGTDVSCFGGNDGSATVVASNGVSPYTYDWNTTPAQSTPTVNNLSAGTYTVIVTDSIGCFATDSITINEPPIISLTLASTDPPCFGTNGTATVTAMGGTGSYTYNWNSAPPQTTATASLPAGTWNVTVTDANGCTADTSVTLVQPSLLTASSSFTAVTCNGTATGTATGTANGGTPPYSYNWLPGGQTTATATNLPAGTYTLTVTDSMGCTATTSVTVTEPTALALTGSTTDASCNGFADGTATVNASGGTNPYSYNWNTSPTQINATATNLAAGTYTCYVTDGNGCMDSISLTVMEPTALVISVTSVDETCQGFNDGSATVVATGATPPYLYNWSNGGSGSSIGSIGVGTYTVTVTDANGCTLTGSTTVGAPAPPIANAGMDISVCEGEGGDTLNGSASGGAGGYFYSWSCANPPCGLSSPFSQSPLANPTATMTYYLQVTDMNGCPSALDSVVVNVIPKPQVNAGPDLFICGLPAGGAQINATVTGSPGPFSYSWTPTTGLNNPNIANPFARPDTTTIYTLTVVDLSTGCTSQNTTVDTNSTVTVHVAPIPIAEAGPDRSICEGESIQLQGYGFGAGPAYDFQWSPANSLSNPAIPNPIASPSLTTEYILTVISNGCPSFGDTVRVTVNANPTADAGPDRDRCFGDAAMLDGQAGGVLGGSNFDFFWWPGVGLSDSTAEDPIANPTLTTRYYMYAVSDSGCRSATDSVLFTVRPTPIANAGPDIVYCQGGDIHLAGSYSWENGNQPGDLSAVNVKWEPAQFVVGPNDQDSVIVDPPSSMWFYYTVTYDSCFHTDSMLVTVLPDINATLEADTNTICEGDSVLLTASGGLGGGTFRWLPAEGIANPGATQTMAGPEVSTTYMVIITEAGCSDTASVEIMVNPTPDMAYISSINEGCAPFTVHFMQTVKDAQFYVWDFGDGSAISNNHQPVHTYDAPGLYTVSLTGMGVGGCSAEIIDLQIRVIEKEAAAFTSNPEFPVQLVLPNTEVQFFDESPNATSWNWEFGNGLSSDEINPIHTYQEPGEYYVTLNITNELGCISEVTHGPYIVLAPELFIPNVFSPNNDGINDRLRVDYSGNQPFTLQVYDRWGVLQYDTRNKIEGWDGMVNGEMAPEGVYYYTLKVGDREFNGNITLLR